MTTTEHHVRPGQVWADNDARMEGRTLRVERIETHTFGVGGLEGKVPHAVCTVLTPADDHPITGRTGHQVTIRVSRMRPTSTGYRLLHETQPECLDEDIEDGLRYVCRQPQGHDGHHQRVFEGHVTP